MACYLTFVKGIIMPGAILPLSLSFQKTDPEGHCLPTSKKLTTGKIMSPSKRINTTPSEK